MTPLWFSRIRLKRDAQVQAMVELLLPNDDQRTMLAARHKLIWSLFADGPDRKRDFLWREDRRGVFYTLSARRPANPLFDIETKEWAPVLAPGDRLAFSLRANPVISRKTPGKRHSQRHDVVMDRLRTLRPHDPSRGDPGERRAARNRVIQEAGQEWLAAQGERHGFKLLSVKCDGYHQHVLHRGRNRPPGNISTLDFAGALTVTDPERFLARVASGIGPAKAFGCGLMLIRRA